MPDCLCSKYCSIDSKEICILKFGCRSIVTYKDFLKIVEPGSAVEETKRLSQYIVKNNTLLGFMYDGQDGKLFRIVCHAFKIWRY